jgi:hypothetical protein
MQERDVAVGLILHRTSTAGGHNEGLIDSLDRVSEADCKNVWEGMAQKVTF